MTVNNLLEKARKEAIKRTEDYYKEICEGCCDYKQEIENDKLTGKYQKELESFTLDCIYDVKKTIRESTLIDTSQKQQIIDEINKCDEIQKRDSHVAMLFANHFVRYKDVYLK